MDEKMILVVDDEEQVRALFKEFFSRQGYGVRVAKNGEEAVEIMEKENIRVMFFDLNMPGMNGVELCIQLLENDLVTCIYAVTGDSSSFELTKCRKAGFDDYFVKPVKLKLLLKAAQNAFEKIERWEEFMS